MTDSTEDVGAALEDAAKAAGFIDPTDVRMYLDPADSALTREGAPDTAMIAAAVTAVVDQRPYLTNGGQRAPRRGSAHQGAGRGGAARAGLSVDPDAQLERLRARDAHTPTGSDGATDTTAGATGSRQIDRLRARSPIHADHH